VTAGARPRFAAILAGLRRFLKSMNTLRGTLLLGLLLALAACGQKGPLYLPGEPEPPAAAAGGDEAEDDEDGGNRAEPGS
jgi:predicted small lipoprotein YifL